MAKNIPYVRSFTKDDGSQGWKAMNKHGKTKFFGQDFKSAAHKHAGIPLNEVSDNFVGKPEVVKKFKAMTPGQEDAKVPLKEEFKVNDEVYLKDTSAIGAPFGAMKVHSVLDNHYLLRMKGHYAKLYKARKDNVHDKEGHKKQMEELKKRYTKESHNNCGTPECCGECNLGEGKMKQLSHDIENMNPGSFKNKYGKDKKVYQRPSKVNEGYEEDVDHFIQNRDSIKKEHNKKSDYHYEKAKEHSEKATLNGTATDLKHLSIADKHRKAMRAHADASLAIASGRNEGNAMNKSKEAHKLSNSLNEDTKQIDESRHGFSRSIGRNRDQVFRPGTVGTLSSKTIHHNKEHSIEVVRGMTVFKSTPHYVFHNDKVVHGTWSENNALAHAKKLEKKLEKEKSKQRIDELSKGTMKKYQNKVLRYFDKHPSFYVDGGDASKDKTLGKRLKGYSKSLKHKTNEEIEQIDEQVDDGWKVNPKNSTWSPWHGGDNKDTYKKLGMRHANSKKKRMPMSSDWAQYHYDSGYNSIKEEVESIDELSKETLINYRQKAVGRLNPVAMKKRKADQQVTNRIRSGKTLKDYKPKDELSDEEKRLYKNKSRGESRARGRLNHLDGIMDGKKKTSYKDYVKEELEGLNELSYNRYDQYFTKAAMNRAKAEKEGDNKTVAKRDRGLKIVVHKQPNKLKEELSKEAQEATIENSYKTTSTGRSIGDKVTHQLHGEGTVVHIREAGHGIQEIIVRKDLLPENIQEKESQIEASQHEVEDLVNEDYSKMSTSELKTHVEKAIRSGDRSKIPLFQAEIKRRMKEKTGKDYEMPKTISHKAYDDYERITGKKVDRSRLKEETILIEDLNIIEQSHNINVRVNGKEKKVDHTKFHKDMARLMAGHIDIATFKNRNK